VDRGGKRLKKVLNDKWIVVFKGGKHVDSAGVERDGDALIDQAVAQFDPAYHEPPICVGHPEHDSPAHGWVKGLKSAPGKDGKLLLIKPGDVPPQFEEDIKAGMYRKWSAAFYSADHPDPKLRGAFRHAAILGAMVPAVKGLPAIQFKDPDGEYIRFDQDGALEFADTSPWTWQSLRQLARNLREWIIETDGKDRADSVVPGYLVEDIENEENRQANSPPEGEGMSFTEAQVNEKIEAAKAQAKAEAEAEAKARYDRQMQAQAAQKEAVEFCEGLVRDGKLPPALCTDDLKTFVASLEGGGELEFSEGRKQPQGKFFREWLGGLSESALFSEIATTSTAGKMQHQEPFGPNDMLEKM